VLPSARDILIYHILAGYASSSGADSCRGYRGKTGTSPPPYHRDMNVPLLDIRTLLAAGNVVLGPMAGIT
jgi:hypothetical protein